MPYLTIDGTVSERSGAFPGARVVFLAIGLVCTVIGVIGLVLPGLPGTVFLLAAVWAFSRSSERLADWLYRHPRFGATLRDWQRYRVIPVRAKILAVTMMFASLVIMLFFSDLHTGILVGVSLCMGCVAVWIVWQRPVPPVTAALDKVV